MIFKKKVKKECQITIRRKMIFHILKNIIIVNYNKKIKKFKIFFIIDFSFLKFIIKYEQNI